MDRWKNDIRATLTPPRAGRPRLGDLRQEGREGKCTSREGGREQSLSPGVANNVNTVARLMNFHPSEGAFPHAVLTA